MKKIIVVFLLLCLFGTSAYAADSYTGTYVKISYNKENALFINYREDWSIGSGYGTRVKTYFDRNQTIPTVESFGLDVTYFTKTKGQYRKREYFYTQDDNEIKVATCEFLEDDTFNCIFESVSLPGVPPLDSGGGGNPGGGSGGGGDTPPASPTNLRVTGAGDGWISLAWDPVDHSSYLVTYYDSFGIRQDYVTINPNFLRADLTNGYPYTFSVYAVDQYGNYSDPVTITATPTAYGDDDPPNGGDPGSVCVICEKLAAVLECPYWEDYLSDLRDTIADAIPPPPNWYDVADIFADAYIDALSDYLGSVPSVPSTNHLRPAMPSVNNASPEAQNLQPIAPPEYQNGSLPFDLSDAPEIEIVDESEPFDIVDPVEVIQADPVGKKVLPGDPGNHTGGIKHPDEIQTEDPFPVPLTEVSPPDNPIPIPDQIQGEPGAIPELTTGEIPIPQIGGDVD